MAERYSQKCASDKLASLTGVSVVIPCYNGAQFLAEAVDSALRQTHPEIEIIVIDDGSTDSSPQIAKSFGDRVRYIFQENAGLSAARNTGIKAATKPLVTFLDADDRILPEMLETLVRCIETLPASFAIVACHPENIDAQGKTIFRNARFAPLAKEVTMEDLIQKSRFPCNVVARREAFEKCGFFDTALKSSEDRDMWIRIAARYRIQLLPDKLAQIRRHADNMSKNAVRQSRSIRMVLTKALRAGLVTKWNLPFWCKAYSIYFFQSGLMFAEAGANARGATNLILSICLWPCFGDPAKLGQPSFFRVRRILRILLESVVPAIARRRDLKERPAPPARVEEPQPLSKEHADQP